MGSEFIKWIKVHVLSSFACNGKVGLVTQQESGTPDVVFSLNTGSC